MLPTHSSTNSLVRTNLIRISLTSFLAYFIMSAIISPLGIVSQSIAEYYSVSIPAATAIFSSLTTGILVGSIIAVFVFDYLQIKVIAIAAAALIGSNLLAIYALNSFLSLSICLFLVGTGCGVALSTAAVVISKAYSEQLRASMLLLTDSFYSVGATFSTFLAVYLIGLGWHWWSIYLLAICAVTLLILLALFSSYPESNQEQQNAKETSGDKTDGSTGKWPISVYLCGLTLLIYMLGLVTVYSWIPNFAQQTLGLEQDAAGNLVGRLFSGMFFGQLCMFVLALRLPVKLLVVGCLGLASVATLSLWMDLPSVSIQIRILALGFVGGGILKVAIAYGSTLSSQPSAKMVSYLLFNTALGTAIAPALSAWIVEQGGTHSVMVFASACYFSAVVLLLVTYVLEPNPNQ